MKVAAIVPSAGMGRRLNSDIEKPYIKLNGMPMLVHTLRQLSNNKKISEIVVVVRGDRIEYVKNEIVSKYRIRDTIVVAGGSKRQDSVWNGLRKVSKDMEYILIHDGVRPFINNKLINSLLKAAVRFKASVLCVPVKPTLKVVGKDNLIKYTPDRNVYMEAQTPQVFKRSVIEKAYKMGYERDIKATDDSMLVEMTGIKPKIVLGSYNNIKITTKEDLELAKILFKNGNR
jgi:2-C-methyl-D-erythritol 4-phosphate cytidylyltransferase